MKKKKQTGSVSGRSKHLPLGVVDIAKQLCVESGASGVSRAGTRLAGGAFADRLVLPCSQFAC